MKLKEVKIDQQFRVKELESKGRDIVFTIRSRENNGCEIWEEGQGARSYWDNETEVELITESAKELPPELEKLKEQIQKIRERNPKEVADQLVREAIEMQVTINMMSIINSHIPKSVDAMINGTDLRGSDMGIPDSVKGVYEKWAEQEFAKIHTPEHQELMKQSLSDDIMYGESMIHIDSEGKERRIVPYSEEWWEIKDKQLPKLKLDTISEQGEQLLNHSPVTDTDSKVEVYESLEELLTDIYNINGVTLWSNIVDIQEKLKATIASGKYLENNPMK